MLIDIQDVSRLPFISSTVHSVLADRFLHSPWDSALDVNSRASFPFHFPCTYFLFLLEKPTHWKPLQCAVVWFLLELRWPASSWLVLHFGFQPFRCQGFLGQSIYNEMWGRILADEIGLENKIQQDSSSTPTFYFSAFAYEDVLVGQKIVKTQVGLVVRPRMEKKLS